MRSQRRGADSARREVIAHPRARKRQGRRGVKPRPAESARQPAKATGSHSRAPRREARGPEREGTGRGRQARAPRYGFRPKAGEKANSYQMPSMCCMPMLTQVMPIQQHSPLKTGLPPVLSSFPISVL